MAIRVDIDVMLARRKMAVGELAERIGITPANLAVLKNGRAKAVRFTTLQALCRELDCQPGDLLKQKLAEIHFLHSDVIFCHHYMCRKFFSS